MSAAAEAFLAAALRKADNAMEKEVGTPSTGLVGGDGPESTLWNIFNVIEVLSKVAGDHAESSADNGVICMLDECKAAACYEAARLNILFEEMAKQANS